MYALIEDARMAAMSAAEHWHETLEAKLLLGKIDAFERSSDRWYGECQEASKAFSESAQEARDELDDLRREAIDRAADTYGDRRSDEWLDAWGVADEEVPTLEEVIQAARRRGDGDGYFERFAA
jgi:hypothetical protein